MKNLPIPFLKECFRIEANGDLFWLVRPRKHFNTQRAHSIWNKRFAGNKCGCIDSRGYLVTGINGSLWSNHRIIFAMVNGYWPDEVDHFDQDQLNNDPENLIDSNKNHNKLNRGMRKDNKTGVTGVDLLSNGSYRARITKDGRTITLGCFATLEVAKETRIAAQQSAGFSSNHGMQK